MDQWGPIFLVNFKAIKCKSIDWPIFLIDSPVYSDHFEVCHVKFDLFYKEWQLFENTYQIAILSIWLNWRAG